MYEDIPYDHVSPLYDPIAVMFDESDDDDDDEFLMSRMARRHRAEEHRRTLDDEILRMPRIHRPPEQRYSPEHGSHRYTQGIHDTHTGPAFNTGSVDEYLQ